MSISVVCSTCAAKLRAPDSSAGRTLQCPKCGAAVRVPGPAQRAPAPPPPSSPLAPPVRLGRAPEPPPQPAYTPEGVAYCPFCDLRWFARDPTAGGEILCPKCGVDVS